MNLQRAQINESMSRDSVTSMWIPRIVKRKDTITINCTSTFLHVKWAKEIYANVRKRGLSGTSLLPGKSNINCSILFWHIKQLLSTLQRAARPLKIQYFCLKLVRTYSWPRWPTDSRTSVMSSLVTLKVTAMDVSIGNPMKNFEADHQLSIFLLPPEMVSICTLNQTSQ